MQADLRVMRAWGVHGVCALTAVTAQHPAEVSDVHLVPASVLRAQIHAVTTFFPVRAAKTGMLGGASLAVELCAAMDGLATLPWVVDPVLVASSGAVLGGLDMLALYRERICPRASLVTPNLPEAKALIGEATWSSLGGDPTRVAVALSRSFGTRVLLKGGHAAGDPVDVYAEAGEGPETTTRCWTRARIQRGDTHGTGCSLSAAITACLARGLPCVEACESAFRWMTTQMQAPVALAPDYEAHLFGWADTLDKDCMPRM